jgi:hypothetical protein
MKNTRLHIHCCIKYNNWKEKSVLTSHCVAKLPYVHQAIFIEKVKLPLLVKKYLTLYGPGGSLPSSQKPYTEQRESSPHPRHVFIQG